MVCGAPSGAGKSTVVCALCRIWSDAGRDVVPFKAQNMSNHSAVTAEGGEIGRAQELQVATTDAVGCGDTVQALREVVLDAFAGLRCSHDWVVGEGAGGATEVNLQERDLVNLPLAAATGTPAIVVVDIDRSGAFAGSASPVTEMPGWGR